MAISMKCAACGADVEFPTELETEEVVCPGCEVLVRRRPGDEKMAMPVGMELPEKFRPLDLERLGKQSELLVGRYNKRAEEQAAANSMGSQVDLTLAKALESLAQTIGHLDERLSAQERRSGGMLPPMDVPGGGDYDMTNGRAPGLGESGVEEDPDVVQLEPEEEERAKARPLGAPVLVRREAAREAHHFRRERQRHWDDRGREEKKLGWFAALMEKAPKTTAAVTIGLAVAVVLATIMWMERGGFFTPAAPEKPTELETTSMSQLYKDDPEAAQAEMVARAFLSATGAKVAKPFVYQADKIDRKFMELYRPVRSPDDYELMLKSRAMAPRGQSVFAFRVSMEEEATRTLVVLPEGTMPKVFWEFFAEVGDFSWQEFMDKRPDKPVMMRVWAYKGDRYESPYTPEQWQSYVLHDSSENRVLYGYARKNEKEDWRLSDALDNRPVKFGRRDEVMAQVDLVFMAEMTREGSDREYVVEIKGVPVTSWLPADFAPRSTLDR
jgi:DNA-directed RNA polymerase subunit RPC12/RpoP